MSGKLTPADIAKRLSTSPNTVRRLTASFSDWLSNDATPPTGGRRLYSEEDLAILEFVLNMRNRGADDPTIIARLERGIPLPRSSPEPATLPPAPAPAAIDVQPLITALEEQASAQRRLLATLATAREEEIAALRRLATAIEAQGQAHDRLINAAHLVFAGLAALVVIMLLTLAVAVGWIG